MEASKEIRTMRVMAWRRAKGELESIKATYWSDEGGAHGDFDQALNYFVTTIDDKGLCD